MQNNIIFCTVIFGLFLTLPLLGLARRRAANLWLGLFVAEFSWLALGDYFLSSELFWRHPRWLLLFHWPVAGIGPLYYCYVRAVTGLELGRGQAWHAVPQVLLVAVLAWYALDGAAAAPTGQLSSPNQMLGGSLLVCQFLSAAYAVAVLLRLRLYRDQVRARHSSTAGRDLRWLQWTTAAILLMLVLWIPAVQLGGYWEWSMLAGRLGLFIALGWYGLGRPALFAPAPLIDSAAPAPDRKYARSGMTADAQALIGQRLVRRMHERRDFLEPDLKLVELAERIGTSPQLLSEYLNTVLGLSFFDYVNGQRAQEVQRLMGAPAHAASTLMELALAAGFNSKSTFNIAFKKTASMTPSAWRKTCVPIG